MRTNISKEIEEKVTRFISRNPNLPWSTKGFVNVGILRIGVLTERDWKLENFCNTHNGSLPGFDTKAFEDIKINEIMTNFGKFKVIVDEDVDYYYCEFETFKLPSFETRLHEPEMVVNHENTLENFKGYKSVRMCGNTTRLIDHAVQIIMSGKICHVLDHHEMGESVAANNKLASKIMYRLHNEFNHLQFKYDTFKNTISFKNIY